MTMAKAPFRAGSLGGRKLPYQSYEAAVDAVRRLWIDGQPMVLDRLVSGLVAGDADYEHVEMFTTRPTSPEQVRQLPTSELATWLRNLTRTGKTHTYAYRTVHAELASRPDHRPEQMAQHAVQPNTAGLAFTGWPHRR
jgi:hypothetical protein